MSYSVIDQFIFCIGSEDGSLLSVVGLGIHHLWKWGWDGATVYSKYICAATVYVSILTVLRGQ